MKKATKISSIIIICVLIVISLLLVSGIFVLDYSVKFVGERVYWNDSIYVQCSGKYHEGKTLAKTSNGRWRLNSVEEDDSHIFVVMRSFLDNYLFVREDYIIPKNGKLTAVVWNSKKITDPKFCQIINEIYENNGNTFEYETEGIYVWKEAQHMKDLYFGYENCPIGAVFIGYLGKVNDKWVITVDISTDTRNEDGSPKPYKVICKEIPNKYIPELEKHFNYLDF